MGFNTQVLNFKRSIANSITESGLPAVVIDGVLSDFRLQLQPQISLAIETEKAKEGEQREKVSNTD